MQSKKHLWAKSSPSWYNYGLKHKTVFFRRCKWTKLQAAGVFLRPHAAPFKIQAKFVEASLLEAGEQFPWGRFGSSLQCNWITGSDRMLAPRSSPNALSEGNRTLAAEIPVHKEVMNHLLSWVLLLLRELHKRKKPRKFANMALETKIKPRRLCDSQHLYSSVKLISTIFTPTFS